MPSSVPSLRWAATIDPGRLPESARDMTDTANTMKSMNAKRAEEYLKKSGYGTDIAEFNERRKAVNRRIQAEKKAASPRTADSTVAPMSNSFMSRKIRLP